MTVPDQSLLFDAYEASWPPASLETLGPFTIRDGKGGGKRVTSATLDGAMDDGAIDAAIEAMTALGQRPIFQVRQGEADLDQNLADRGFEIIDPVTAYLVTPTDIADPTLHRLASIPCSAPLAIQAEIWAEGGIGPARLAVMARASDPKTYLLGRHADQAAGAAFISVYKDIAVLHALEVRPDHRRNSVARNLMIGAANWAAKQNATALAVLVVDANDAANALYVSLGMSPVGGYHYRIAANRTAP